MVAGGEEVETVPGRNLRRQLGGWISLLRSHGVEAVEVAVVVAVAGGVVGRGGVCQRARLIALTLVWRRTRLMG